jgi:hypothetical protein
MVDGGVKNVPLLSQLSPALGTLADELISASLVVQIAAQSFVRVPKLDPQLLIRVTKLRSQLRIFVTKLRSQWAISS